MGLNLWVGMARHGIVGIYGIGLMGWDWWDGMRWDLWVGMGWEMWDGICGLGWDLWDVRSLPTQSIPGGVSGAPACPAWAGGAFGNAQGSPGHCLQSLWEIFVPSGSSFIPEEFADTTGSYIKNQSRPRIF